MFDPVQLREALDRITSGDWSLPSTFEVTGVHAGYRRIVLVDNGYRLPAAGPFRFALEPFGPVHTAWLASIDPGGYIVAHRDGGPYRERWHIPITAAGTISHNGHQETPQDGIPFQVTHWQPHSVSNPTDRARVHLVIDRDITLDVPTQSFALIEEQHEKDT